MTRPMNINLYPRELSRRVTKIYHKATSNKNASHLTIKCLLTCITREKHQKAAFLGNVLKDVNRSWSLDLLRAMVWAAQVTSPLV